VDDFSSGIQLADIDLDGDLDVVSRNFSGLVLYSNDGSVGLVLAGSLFSPSDGSDLIGLVAHDLDGDTDTDLVVSLRNFDFSDPFDPEPPLILQTVILENQGVGSSNFSMRQTVATYGGYLSAADVNNDGRQDILVVCDCESTKVLLTMATALSA